MKFITTFACLVFFISSSVSATEPAKPAAAATTDAATEVNKVITDFAQNNPLALWNALPKSYQADINQLVSNFTSIYEKDVYNRLMNLLRRVVTAVKSKRAIILQMAAKKGPPNKRQEFEKNFDGLIAVLEALMKSQIMDYDKMRNADVGKFIGTHGTATFRTAVALSGKNPLTTMLGDLRVKEVSRKGNDVMLDEVLNGKLKGKPEAYVNVEGKWIPKQMMIGWKPGVAMANAKIAQLRTQSKKQNETMRKVLPLIEKLLADFEKIDNEAQLSVFPLQAMMLGQ